MLRRQRRSRIHGARVLASRLIRPQRDPARASPLRMGSCECATSYGPNPQPWTSRRTASRRSSSPTAPAPGSLCPTLSPEISTVKLTGTPSHTTHVSIWVRYFGAKQISPTLAHVERWISTIDLIVRLKPSNARIRTSDRGEKSDASSPVQRATLPPIMCSLLFLLRPLLLHPCTAPPAPLRAGGAAQGRQ
ncbi:uncharacterized protein LOC120670945 [Panicum virgatum]|uniref:uncharacterized protein LOC120670945 n=1 Tax=Panicum virgatum TaxID=38727 RepID=UPI0019D4FB10|nr:uncharacterized protein LOC120670945 [Panicum virgatum]